MSLTVPADLLDQARDGEVGDREFLACVASSLPYAWNLITGLVGELEAGRATSPTTGSRRRTRPRGQLLRLMASDSMRAAIERRYGVTLAFQNCHRAAVFRPGATRSLEKFRSPRSQLLNQSPEFVDC